MTQLLRNSHAHLDERLVAAAALGRVSDDEHVRLLSLAILVTTVAREPYGVATNEAAASLAGVDAKPGNGVQETARVVVESEKFETLNLDDDFVETLRKIAGGEIDWGMPRASIQ